MENKQTTTRRKRRISDAAVQNQLLFMCLAAGAEGSVTPDDVARALYPKAWQTVLKRVRLTAKQLAAAGYITILRKGKPADPDEVKGLIKLRTTGLTPPDYEPPDQDE